jgi:hypothetical protein
MIVPPPDSNGAAETTQPLPDRDIIGYLSNQVDCDNWYAPIAGAYSANQMTAVKLLNG